MREGRQKKAREGTRECQPGKVRSGVGEIKKKKNVLPYSLKHTI